MGIFRIYSTILNKYPLFVNSVQSGILVGSGDVIAQLCIEKKRDYDSFRSMKFFSYGIVIGPTIHSWYSVLERLFGKKSLKAGINKVIVDQGIFAPVFLLCFMSTVSALDGLSKTQIKQKVKQDYSDVLLANYKVWPLAQLTNFLFVPFNYRVLFVQFIALGWNTYLSWKMHTQIKIESS